MESNAGRVFLSRFMMWIAAALVGSYFLFSINLDVFKKPAEEGQPELTTIQKFMKMVTIPNINLGIDLQGGAHLVVSVEIEKAIENRLVTEGKGIDQLFKKHELQKLPAKKDVSGKSIVMEFENENDASAAYKIIKDGVSYLKTSRKAEILTVALLPQEENRIRAQAVEQAINILSRRLDSAGVQGLTVQQHGERQIVVQLPGEQDVEEKKELISKTAHLEFKIVEQQAASEDALLDKFDGDLPADKMIIQGREDGRKGFYLVSAFPDLTGEHIVNARMDFDKYGKAAVHFTLDSAGSQEFAELTSNNVGKPLGIVIDNIMYSSPNINEPITGGSCQISGNFTSEEAKNLEIVLNSGALKAPLKFESESRVGASLGQDSIRKGIFSCLIGLALLLFFSIFYYRLAGLFAMLALFFNLFLILLFLSGFKFALTLPGIAGMVLTIGMAIDASILIYEKIREELSEGSTIRKAINDGFAGAMVVILDSNITTFLTGLVLFKFGSPAIRGFAVTLMVGIVATILSGVFFLKAIFEFVLDNTSIREFSFHVKK